MIWWSTERTKVYFDWRTLADEFFIGSFGHTEKPEHQKNRKLSKFGRSRARWSLLFWEDWSGILSYLEKVRDLEERLNSIGYY
jgi:hypothetical protein